MVIQDQILAEAGDKPLEKGKVVGAVQKLMSTSWKRAVNQIAQQTQTTQQTQPAATVDSNYLDSLPLSSLAADDSGPPEVYYGPEQPLTASTPRATTTPISDTQSIDPYCQIIPGMSQCLYLTITADGSLNTPVSDNCSTLYNQITSELDRYLQEATERHEVEDNYYDRCHKSTNTSPTQQEDSYLDKEQDNNSSNTKLKKPSIPESH